jgi:hypothetical protein
MPRVKDAELWKGVRTVGAWPCVYFADIDTIAVADLHLGQEGVMAEREGIAVPKVQLKQILAQLEAIVRGQPASRLAIVGDLRPGFGRLSVHEIVEIRAFLGACKKWFTEVLVLRGNHDNYIARLAEHAGTEFVPEKVLGRTLFHHGDAMPEAGDGAFDTLVIGHEHPAITMRRGRIAEKAKAIAYGEVRFRGRKKRLVVLPAMSPLAAGTALNECDGFLSPILRAVDVDRLKVLALVEGEVLAFPELGKVKKALARL